MPSRRHRQVDTYRETVLKTADFVDTLPETCYYALQNPELSKDELVEIQETMRKDRASPTYEVLYG